MDDDDDQPALGDEVKELLARHIAKAVEDGVLAALKKRAELLAGLGLASVGTSNCSLLAVLLSMAAVECTQMGRTFRTRALGTQPVGRCRELLHRNSLLSQAQILILTSVLVQIYRDMLCSC